MIEYCNLCAHNCNINRKYVRGKCKCGNVSKVALSSLHMWEEPCISGGNGSGTIFFSGCNFNCIFCQNYSISQTNKGIEYTDKELASLFIDLQNKNADNINLVTPTPYVYNIIEAIKIARRKGLAIPIIYNTNGYENVETIKMLSGYIDIYLPDFKYFDNDIGYMLSNCRKYFEVASNCILEMQKQIGDNIFDKNGIMKRGLIVRHLVLPNHITQTKKIISWIKENMKNDTYVSIMTQYFPTYRANENSLLNRKLSKMEYKIILKLVENLEYGYIQEYNPNCNEEEYVPKFL